MKTLALTVVLILSVIATLFVIGISLFLLIRKALEIRSEKLKNYLFNHYSKLFAQALLKEYPEISRTKKPSDKFKYYEDSISKIKMQIQKLSTKKRSLHRNIIRLVLIELSQTVKGEVSDRLVYYVYSLNILEDLNKMMASKHWWIRAQAAQELGALGAKRGIVPLTAALEDPVPDVRSQAINSLLKLAGVIELRNILRLVKSLTHFQAVELSTIVAGYREEALPYLLEALSYEDVSVKLFAIKMLGKIRSLNAVDPLFRFCKSGPEPVLYSAAIEALGLIGSTDSLPVIVEATKHNAIEVRTKALEALGNYPMEESAEILIKKLISDSVIEKRISANSLIKMKEIGRKMLNQVLKESDHTTSLIIEEVLEEVE